MGGGESLMLSNINFIVLIAYLVSVVGLGLWLGRKNPSTDEFMAAGRSLPGWAIGLSMFGSYISSLSFLANPGKSYATDWNAFAFTIYPVLSFADFTAGEKRLAKAVTDAVVIGNALGQ